MDRSGRWILLRVDRAMLDRTRGMNQTTDVPVAHDNHSVASPIADVVTIGVAADSWFATTENPMDSRVTGRSVRVSTQRRDDRRQCRRRRDPQRRDVRPHDADARGPAEQHAGDHGRPAGTASPPTAMTMQLSSGPANTPRMICDSSNSVPSVDTMPAAAVAARPMTSE